MNVGLLINYICDIVTYILPKYIIVFRWFSYYHVLHLMVGLSMLSVFFDDYSFLCQLNYEIIFQK